MIKIKKTKSIEINYDPERRMFTMTVLGALDSAGWESVNIPLSKIPQIVRGLFSGFVRFYRKHEKNN